MKAMRLVSVGEALQLCDVPMPEPRPGWVVIKVEAAGLCRSDLHLMAGAQFVSTTGSNLACQPPLTLGHEIAGTIVELGEGVTGWSIGDDVVSANDPSNAGLGSPGNTLDGGFAEYCALPARRLVRVPEGLSLDVAAVATDSINTAHFAVRNTGKMRSAERVGIVGLGGLGMSGLRSARLLSETVYGVDVNADCFPAALSAGAADCFSDVSQLRSVEPTLIIDFVGSSSSIAAALDAVVMGGRVVVVGLASKSVAIDSYDLILGEKSLHGSHGGDFASLESAMHLARAGQLRPEIVEIPFEEIDAAYDKMRRNEVGPCRMVTRP